MKTLKKIDSGYYLDFNSSSAIFYYDELEKNYSGTIYILRNAPIFLHDMLIYMIRFKKQIDILQKIIFDIDISQENLNKLFMVAIASNNIDLVKIFLNLGADINNENGLPIKLAVSMNNLPIVKLLVENGANLRVDNDFVLRAFEDNLEGVKYCLDNGADIHADNDYILRYNCNMSDIENVEYLIEAGANMHANNDYCLRISVKYGDHDIVEILLNAGADITALNYKSLLGAIKSKSSDLIELLLKSGADIDNLKKHIKPLDEDTEKIMNLLEEKGLEIKEIMSLLCNPNDD